MTAKEKLKDRIRELLSSGKTLYYSQISEALGDVDIRFIVDACNELEEAGEIGLDEIVLNGARHKEQIKEDKSLFGRTIENEHS